MQPIVDRIVWQTRYAAGSYLARVTLHVPPMQSPGAMTAFFAVTRDRERGQARQWCATRTSTVYQHGTPTLPSLVGYGRTRDDAIRNALHFDTK